MCSSPLRGTGDYRLLWDGIVKSVLALCLMCVSYAGVTALKCTPCNPSMCPHPPRDCPRGTILDVCGCCQVCGKNVNETCGGPFEILGKCGDGLECALTSEVGGLITGSEKGICREKCQSVVCPWIQDYFPVCPKDSHLLPSVQSKDGCCLEPPGCGCDKCTPELCPRGLRVQVLEEGTGTPGHCCSKFRCVNDEQTTVEVHSLSEPKPSVIVKEEAERDPVKNNKNATTIIICVLAAIVIILLMLLVFFFLFKYGKRKSVSKKYSPKSADIENVSPVQVKLLGYEASEKPVKKSEQSRNADLLYVSKLSDEEKHVNLLSKEFDKTNCVKFDDGFY
ncbi:cysteine-rich motor neuron 1 protein-like [Saccostrea echinata]|uniref:cysteine-rich motor neuron 1 protein-like n=1 Tax=Saccostrea echinata TaxID=191078 RepID=UPI002A83DE1D|nr:cysteine-rich motor neuron 1 protein-like [Saccostrea echinata]